MSSIEQRLARLEAIEAIRQLKYRYFLNCDRKRPVQVRACFVDGPCPIDFGRIGRFETADELVDTFTRLACHEHIVEMHHAQNPLIEVLDEDRARGTWGLYYFLVDTSNSAITQLGGCYEDEYRREGGQWRISACRYEVTSSTLLGWSDGLLQLIFAGRSAPAELDDPGRQAG